MHFCSNTINQTSSPYAVFKLDAVIVPRGTRLFPLSFHHRLCLIGVHLQFSDAIDCIINRSDIKTSGLLGAFNPYHSIVFHNLGKETLGCPCDQAFCLHRNILVHRNFLVKFRPWSFSHKKIGIRFDTFSDNSARIICQSLTLCQHGNILLNSLLFPIYGRGVPFDMV